MRGSYRIIVTVCLVSLMSGGIAVSSGAAEFRGMWVDAWNEGFKTPAQVTSLVSAANAHNLNALLVQVRKRGDAYYSPTVEPKASDIVSDFDPLTDVLTKAHAAGIEVHAWLTLYDVWNTATSAPLTGGHVYAAHSEWLTKSDQDVALFGGKHALLDPGLPEVRQYLKNVVLDVVNRYDVDGIHLDGLQLPRRYGYNQAGVDAFNTAYGRSGTPAFDDPAWHQWRRNQATQLISDIYSAVTSAKPRVKVSAAVFADSQVASEYFLQDWPLWLSTGKVDFVVPMAYQTDLPWRFAELVDGALSHSATRHVYIGQGTYESTPEVACRQIETIRAKGAIGFVLFDYTAAVRGTPGQTILDGLSSLLSQPQPVPAMPWKN